MKKPKWLKKYYLKYKVNIICFNIFQFFIIKKENNGKVLITELDGIGDIVVRQKLVDLIAEKHGKENVVLLVTYATELIEMLGYKYEVFEKDSHYNFLNLLKLFNKLCRYGFGTFYSLEFISEDKLEFLKKLKIKKCYAFKGGWLDRWKAQEELVLAGIDGSKVIDRVYEYALNIDPHIEKKALKPQLNLPIHEGDYIAIGVGASDKKKITFPEKLAELLESILISNPNTSFHILGYGKSDNEYFQKLNRVFSKKEKLVNYVNKLNLVETTRQIAGSKLYIGFDSGLYNIAYALGKKQLCLISIKRGKEFYHEDKNISFVYKEMNTEVIEEIRGAEYNNDINLISTQTFKRAFDSLINEE